MPYPDCGCLTATRQGRRRRLVLEHVIEHGVWTTRYGESVGEDHNRCRSRIHADRTRTWFAESQWFALGVIVDAGDRTFSDSNAFTGSTSEAPGRPNRITADSSGSIAVNRAEGNNRSEGVTRDVPGEEEVAL